ncbi:MAG TPA: LysR family transcriptional regulator [Gemmatimonadaceae bacterium]|jgi:DNA-binding transcriptional LysR family regulator|nr:LysR family transcriptional regulator [Gemmatimonadaceae bacterium]
MEIRHLRAFIAVADALSMRRAAERLHVAQSALSRTIRDLEHELGLALFARSSKGVRLTRGGQRFMEGARRTLAEATAAIARARDIRESSDGPLVVGVVNPELRPAWIVAALRQYRAAAPKVAVHLEPMASIAMAEATVTCAIDIGIGYAMVSSRPGVTIDTITEDLLAGVIVGRKHRLARRRSLSIFELERYPFLWHERAALPAVYDRILAAFQQIGFSPRLVPALGQVDTNAASAFALVSSGYGWTLLPTMARSSLPPTVRYIPLSDIAIPLETELIGRSDDRSTRTRAFRRIVAGLVRAT